MSGCGIGIVTPRDGDSRCQLAPWAAIAPIPRLGPGVRAGAQE